jgi:hypothetical protein
MLARKPHCSQDPERGPFFLGINLKIQAASLKSQVFRLQRATCDL